MPDARLTPEQLARYRADYHQCGATIVPLLDHVDALTRELAEARASEARMNADVDASRKMLFADGRAPTENERHLFNLLTWREAEAVDLRADVVRLQTIVNGLAARVVAQSELLSKRAEKGSEPLTAERDRLRALLLAVCGQHPEAVVTDGDTSCTLAHLARRLEGS
jgi:hypothetical protein